MASFNVTTGWAAVVSVVVVCGAVGAASQAADPNDGVAFKVHTLNAESTYSAVAVLDVDRDGDLDVLCGGWWYAAPTWERRAVRDVEVIRGRPDGFSHLPMDVDGDGWTDIVNVNYRSKSLYWVQHPGAQFGPWLKRMIDEPGPMETGRLVDVDGDGKVDVLPNGGRFAAWYELARDESAGDKQADYKWVRHALPNDVAGHGVGFGDVNGDERGDIVGRDGWLEAPEDRRGGEWKWHPEWTLHRDCSIPMLVVDVDGDGDSDVIAGHGHSYGVAWLEQTREGGERAWVRRSIDESWSQAHALLWDDFDGDGQPELVTGKRYMAHEGKDPGAHDPLVVYRYVYDRAAKAWKRHDVATGGRVGFGLDPKAADMDGDGDLDLVVCGRSGLYLLENLRK